MVHRMDFDFPFKFIFYEWYGNFVGNIWIWCQETNLITIYFIDK